MNTETIKMLLVLLAFAASPGAAWLLIYRQEERRLRIAVTPLGTLFRITPKPI